jgi:hypothetical protein
MKKSKSKKHSSKSASIKPSGMDMHPVDGGGPVMADYDHMPDMAGPLRNDHGIGQGEPDEGMGGGVGL